MKALFSTRCPVNSRPLSLKKIVSLIYTLFIIRRRKGGVGGGGGVGLMVSVLDSVAYGPGSSPGALFSEAPETFRARKAMFSSSVSKRGEVYKLETSCMKGTSCSCKEYVYKTALQS